MMSTLSERDQRTLKLGGMGVAAIIVFMVVISPLMDQWKAADAAIARTKSKLSDLQTGLEDASTANQKLKELQARARIHPDLVSLNQQTAQMLRQVETLPGYHDIQVQRLEGMPLREEDRFYRSGVSLQFAGSLGNVQRFMHSVDQASPALKVDRVTINANPKEPGRIDGQMVITGYAVVLKKGTNG